jgi:ribosome-associated toxin RatA of RatAB toxin-antitoxin module
MKTVQKSVLIWYSAAEMFALVTDVARYPEFLPWCDRAQVLDVESQAMTAEIGIALAGVHQSFVTHNHHLPDRQVAMTLVKGPFSKLDGVWNFQPLGAAVPGQEPSKLQAASQRACKVELTLNYGFDNAALAAIVGPVFDKIASSLVDAFVKRAEQVYGPA